MLNHPDLGSVDKGLMQFLKTQYLNPANNQDMSDLVNYLQNTQPGVGRFTWYNKSWVMWAKNPDGTGEMVPAQVNTELKYKGGKTVTSWPKPDGFDYQGMPAYNLTDQYDPPNGDNGNPSVIEAAGPAVRSTLLQTKNDPSVNGLLWTKQAGVTEVPPKRPIVHAARSPAAAGVADAGESPKVMRSRT